MSSIPVLVLGAILGWVGLVWTRKRAARSKGVYDPYEAYRLNQMVEAHKFDRSRDWPF